MNRIKVAVGLSGGVDSAVSALLLKKAGFDVVGVHLYCWPPKSEIEKDGITREEWIKKNGCRADEDRNFALKTALELSIPFKVLDFSEEYNQKVIKYFYDEYEAGRTPNPDVMCNSEIKFGLFLEWALKNGFDYIATGHYAKNLCDNSYVSATSKSENGNVVLPAQNATCCAAENPSSTEPSFSALHNLSDLDDGLPHFCHLVIPEDKHKDQTYFLWKLTQKELKHVLFPLGELKKDEVRRIAEEARLTVAKRKDSQGICFVGNVEARDFLARRLKEKPGMVVNKEGEVIGSHDGVWFYTIGQRGGWEMTPKAQREYVKSGETPVFYVIDKDAKENKLVVGLASQAMEDQFEVREINKISKTKWDFNNLKVRIRHGGELVPSRVKDENGVFTVILDKPLRGIASGQSAVFYSLDDECLGGGIIS